MKRIISKLKPFKLLFITIAVMLIGLAVLLFSWWLWGWVGLDNPISTRATASLAVVAGMGGVVAMTVAYRKQSTAEHYQTQTELTNAVKLLGDDKSQVRIAGVYALMDIGDKHSEMQQRVVNILCGYLRTTRVDDGPVESTIIETLRNHLRPNNDRLIPLSTSRTANESFWKDINIDIHNAKFTEYFNFSGVKISSFINAHAIFNHSHMNFLGADFTGANLIGSNFSEADLTKADFTGAFLFKANFQNANLVGAHFDEAMLRETDFHDAKLHGADFSKSEISKELFKNAIFEGAIYNSKTKWPNDIVPSGAILDKKQN